MVDAISIFTYGGGDIGDLGKSQDVDCGIAKCGQNLSGAGVPNAVIVFSEDRVTDPVEAVLNMPVIAPPMEQLGGADLVTRDAGDRVGRFDRLFAVAKHAASEST